MYTASQLAEQSTPVAFAFSDSAKVAGNLSFYDLDLDKGELGGDISWSIPEDAENRCLDMS